MTFEQRPELFHCALGPANWAVAPSAVGGEVTDSNQGESGVIVANDFTRVQCFEKGLSDTRAL